jgi:hypothetical protein
LNTCLLSALFKAEANVESWLSKIKDNLQVKDFEFDVKGAQNWDCVNSNRAIKERTNKYFICINNN